MLRILILFSLIFLTLGFVLSTGAVCVSTRFDHADRFYCSRGSDLDPIELNDNNQIHRWACDVAIQYDISKGGDTSAGCYDICLKHAVKANAVLSLSDQLKYPHWQSTDYPLFVESEDGYPSSFVNACAVVMHGDEW